MNILEKILEEIEERKEKFIDMSDDEQELCDVEDWYDEGVKEGKVKAYLDVAEIIRSRMDEVSGMRGKRLIDANALDEEVRKFRLTIIGDPSQSTVVRECKESFRRIIDEQPTVYEASDWISVEERLPEEDGFYLATLDGEICGQEEAFTGLAEFEHGKWIDDEEGYKCVLAWQPLPEPYIKNPK